MKQRIKKLRNDLNMTQQEFAERLGLKRQTIAAYEIGKIEPSDSTLLLICDRFGVNEKWLRTGEGDKDKLKEDKFTSYIARIDAGNDDFIEDLIEVYMELDDTSKNALRKLADSMAEKRNRRRQL